MAILTKYSKTQNTQSSQYTTQKEYVESLSTTEEIRVPDDFRTPFTYKEWLQRNVGIIPGQEYNQYNEYLKAWHQNTYTSEDALNKIKEDYYSLLCEISIAFSTPEEVAWFKNLDLTNDLDLEEAIPLFTKKLKEIAIYFINKRDAIKKAKLKYNMVGSMNGIKRLFYEYLLKAFAQREYVLNVPEQSAYETFPELSAIGNGFQIFIDELYDDTSYFDKDPKVAISSYYDLTASDVLDYFNSVDFDISALPWLYETGLSDVYADNLLLTVSSDSESPPSAFSLFDGVLLNKYMLFKETEKYLGETQYIISGGYYELDVRTVKHDFISGNNWFYWPSGEYFRENVNNIIFEPIMLNDTSLVESSAIAGKTYEVSDKIFTQVGKDISGAWLKLTENEIQENVMQASLFGDETTTFKFPYPGYGLSGIDAEWSGPQLSNVLPMDRYSEGVLNAYWGTTPTSAIEPISIHDTTLIDSDAFPAQEYHLADKMFVRSTPNLDKIHDLTPNETYKEEFDRAWLYKMYKTDVPIKVGKTYINWPIYTYENTQTNLPLSIPSSQCIPIALSTLNVEDTMIGSRAGYGVFDSDLIYVLDSSNGYPVQCAWLSGVDITTLASDDSTLMYHATGIIQPSFTLKCRPGRFERFVWYDIPTYINYSTIVHHDHQIDCPYVIKSHKSIYNTVGRALEDLGTNGIGDWNDCRCRAIVYSPLGHPGNKYSDYSYMADIVFVDTQFPNEFDLNTWVGTDGLTYDRSKDFAFFHIISGDNVEQDVGWGNGEWKTGDGSEFQFKPGVVYKYLRANLLRNAGDLMINAVPDIVIKHKHSNTPKAKWKKASLNTDGNWVQTELDTDILLNPNNCIMYDHIDSNWYCITTTGDIGYTTIYEASTRNFNSKWSNYDYVTPTTKIIVSWPDYVYTDGPSHILSTLSAISWSVGTQYNPSQSVWNVDPFATFDFLVEDAGTYNIYATGFGTFGSEVVTNIPSITGVDNLATIRITGSGGVETTYNDRINFIVNVPLSGWDYSSNTYTGVGNGARPFWAKAYDDSSIQTKYKGTMIWGGGIRTVIDDYTLITQPDIATISLSANLYLDYIRMPDNTIIWEEPLNFITNQSKKQWNKLILDKSKLSPLTDYLYNIKNEMIISATDIESDIFLSNENEMFVNYWSNSDFTWFQQLINTTNGIPPTGGKYIEAISGVLVTPIVPYANLTNRHYPTIATMPYVGNLYTSKDSGGYFTPRMLGATVYIGRDWSNTLDTSVISNDVSARGLTASFRNPEAYIGNDRGLTQENQLSPIVNVDSDQRWQKGSVTEGNKAGEVVGVREYQEYIPYQTKYESTTFNFNGIHVQSDKYDPWTGSTDSTWADPTYFPPNFRNEYDIDGWYNTDFPENVFVYQWKTDIFGNQYGLLKSNDIEGVYNRRHAVGELWIRNQEGIIAKVDDLFPTYDLFQDSLSSISYNILDIDLWYDTLMLKTSSHVILEHINFNWDENKIYTTADNINVIDLQALSGGKYGGHWRFEEENKVTLCQVVSDAVNNVVCPILYNYDINSLEMTTVFDFSGNYMVNNLSALNLSYIEEPVFSYNEHMKTYNLSFIGYSDLYKGVIITTMNINKNEGLESVYAITPNPSS